MFFRKKNVASFEDGSWESHVFESYEGTECRHMLESEEINKFTRKERKAQ